MARAWTFEHHFATTVDRPAAAAWADATTLAGIQAELPRLLRLDTEPPVASLDDVLASDAPVVAKLRVGRVEVLRWTPGIASLDVEGRTFVESSTDMTWMRRWRHERRIVELTSGRARVEDRVSGTARLPGGGAVVACMFRARHRRLARLR